MITVDCSRISVHYANRPADRKQTLHHICGISSGMHVKMTETRQGHSLQIVRSQIFEKRMFKLNIHEQMRKTNDCKMVFYSIVVVGDEKNVPNMEAAFPLCTPLKGAGSGSYFCIKNPFRLLSLDLYMIG